MRFILGLILTCLISYEFAEAQQVSQKSTIIETYNGESWYMHFVQSGETVQSISQLYGVTNVEILKSNPEVSSGLRPGRVIRIPVKSSQSVLPNQKPDTVQRTDHNEGFHIVEPKETWYGIAREYKIPVKDLISANESIDTLKVGMRIIIPQIKEAERVITEGYAEHTVLPQETLYGLSRKYNTTIDELMRLNPSLKDGLKIGQVLMVPAIGNGSNGLKVQVTDITYKIHKVQRKETLYSISKMYNVSLDEILAANPDFDGELRKGDELRIPMQTMKVRPFVKPDTVIMGRPINQQAIQEVWGGVCQPLAHNDNIYNIALMIPMKLELVDSIRVSDQTSLKTVNEIESFDFIQFYEGAMIAADSLTSIGMKVKIHVFDTDYGSGVTKTRRVLNQLHMRNMDLIIGPFFAESFDVCAQFAKTNKIPIINPLSRRTALVRDNEYIVKMQPSNWAQYNALSKYIKQAHYNDNIILVRRNQDENNSMSTVIKGAFTSNGIAIKNFHEVIYSSSGWNGINKSLSNTQKNIVIILTNDQAVLPALLRDLSEKADSHQISVVGLSEWGNFELDYNHLVKLNTHFFNPWFVDYENPDVRRFLKKFRSRYVAEPELDKYAFLGYDTMLYFLSAMNAYGEGFLECIKDFNNKGLSNDMIFIKSQDGGYENFGVSIYKFSDYKRIKLN